MSILNDPEAESLATFVDGGSAAIWFCPADQYTCEKYEICRHRKEDRTGYVCDGPITSRDDPRYSRKFPERTQTIVKGARA